METGTSGRLETLIAEGVSSIREGLVLRYYFDIRNGQDFYRDEEGIILPDLRAAEIEAVNSLHEMASQLPTVDERHDMAIEVRSMDGPLFQAALIYTNSAKQ